MEIRINGLLASWPTGNVLKPSRKLRKAVRRCEVEITARNLTLPVQLLRSALQSVPAVKYALGIAGTLSALAIIKSLYSSTEAALMASAAMLVLMSMLCIFSAASKLGPALLRGPAVFFLWMTIGIFFTSAGLCISAAFFDWPKPLTDLTQGSRFATTQNNQDDSREPGTRLPIQVPLVLHLVNESTGDPVANASVYVDDKGHEACPVQMAQSNYPIRCLLNEGDYRVVINYQQQIYSELVHVLPPVTSVTISIPVP
jgi:hypothetical protein